MIKFRLLIPIDQEPMPVMDDTVLPESEENVQPIVVSAAWLGKCRSYIMDSREIGNWFEMFKNDPNSGSRFYVERIYDDAAERAQAVELAELRKKLQG